MVGFIKLHRKLQEWEWYNKSEMVHLFIHLLINANSKDKPWQKIVVKRGQLVTGFSSLSEKTGISIRTLRTCFERLKSTGELSVKTTNKYSVVTICKYDDYNDSISKTDKQNDTQPVTQPTTTKKYKNNNIELSEYDKALNEFIDMRFKMKKPINTDRAYNGLINKLNQLAPNNDELKVKIIDQSILHNYLSFFPLKQEFDLFKNNGFKSKTTEASVEDFNF